MNRYKYSFLLAATLAVAGHAAPPAVQVLAEVHAASRVAVGLLDRLPDSGDVLTEVDYVGTVTAQGLGEIMGWGQDRFDNVDPAVVATIQAGFAGAFREVEKLPQGDADFGYDALQTITKDIRAHLDGIRSAAASGEASTRREVRETAAILTFHAQEIVGSPIVSNNTVGKALVQRNLDLGFTTMKADLASFPDLAEPTSGAMAELAVLRDVPPPCAAEPAPSDACLEGMTDTMEAAFTAIDEAVDASRQAD